MHGERRRGRVLTTRNGMRIVVRAILLCADVANGVRVEREHLVGG